MVFTLSINNITASSTLSLYDDTHVVDASSGGFTITLPQITTDGMHYKLIRTDNTSNTVTIAGDNVSETIDGQTSITLLPENSIQLVSFGIDDGTSGVWYTSDGGVFRPGSALDKEIAVFDGTTGKIVQGAGVRHYGASATDPVSPTPQAGDKYYNTAINHEMCYDATRSKWLSVATLMDGAGRNGTTTADTYYRRWNGMVMSATTGPYIPNNGTIVAVGYTTSAAVTHTYEILVSGAVVTSLPSGGAASAFSNTVDNDFNAGNMSSRNAAGSATTSNFQSTIYYKLRA